VTRNKQPDKTGDVTRNGGPRPGGGRPKGAKNKRTLEIEAAAKQYAGDALKALIKVAKSGKSEGSRVAAAVALLDRGYGRPRQSLEHSGPDGGPIKLATVKVVLVPASAAVDDDRG